jgi:AAA15 family ATPase/GTPase
MKIKSIKISNILSFEHVGDLDHATEITLRDKMNIVIGENGSGKSTLLEVINFMFKKVLFINYDLNPSYVRRASLRAIDKRKVLSKSQDSEQFGNYRLYPNWNAEEEAQAVRLSVELDEVDKKNIANIHANSEKLTAILTKYAEGLSIDPLVDCADTLSFDLHINYNVPQFSIVQGSISHQSTFYYLQNYHMYKYLITLHNLDHPNDQIEPLLETLAIIGGYRNYGSFTGSVNLSQDSVGQLRDLRGNEYRRSLTELDSGEPVIFNMVRLLIARIHFDANDDNDRPTALRLANNSTVMRLINKRLKIVDLRCKLILNDKATWQYTFEFEDTRRHTTLADINSLSAGQKAIIHLVFEAYGRGTLSGGLFIIDEPEIHLHYQFQKEYLKVIEEMNTTQDCQYIFVTHSEALINSETISNVIRLSRNDQGYTKSYSPTVGASERELIKILDNTRSTYAFFSKKVILVEGDTDRYFFNTFLGKVHKAESQEIAVLDINGKGNFPSWKSLFESFGLKVYGVLDFDNVFTLNINGSTLVTPQLQSDTRKQLRQAKLDTMSPTDSTRLIGAYNDIDLANPDVDKWQSLTNSYKNITTISPPELSAEVKLQVINLDVSIETAYGDDIYILKQGALEAYIPIATHGKLEDVIAFCKTGFATWLRANSAEVQELKDIFQSIIEK